MKAQFCPHCGAESSGEYNFCPNCGTRLPEFSDATKSSTESEGTKSKLPVEQPVQLDKDVTRASQASTDDVLICPTCGFQNPVGAKSCDSCGSFLKGVEKSERQFQETPLASSEPRAMDQPKNVRVQSQPSKKAKRKEGKAPAVQQAAQKKFRLSTVQITTIGAALLLGAIFIYGIVSTKSVVPQQDSMPPSGAAQQQAASQPSADVLHEIDRLRQVVDKNPSDLVSTLRLSNMLQDNDMYDQAVVYYKRYLDKIPDNVDARVDYGVTLYESGHTQDAIYQLNQAIKMNPRHQKAFFNLGIVYLNAGEIDKSNEALKKCASIDPNSDVGRQAQQIIEQHANIKN